MVVNELIELREERIEQKDKPSLHEVATALKDGKRRIEVDCEYLVELLDFFQNKTNYTVQTLGDSKERLVRGQEREAELADTNRKLMNKISELIEEKKEDRNQHDSEASVPIRNKEFSTHMIPLSKICSFLNKCVNKFADVYIKLDSEGNFVQFACSEKELK